MCCLFSETTVALTVFVLLGNVSCTSTTQLGKLFQILTIRAEKKYFLKL